MEPRQRRPYLTRRSAASAVNHGEQQLAAMQQQYSPPFFDYRAPIAGGPAPRAPSAAVATSGAAVAVAPSVVLPVLFCFLNHHLQKRNGVAFWPFFHRFATFCKLSTKYLYFLNLPKYSGGVDIPDMSTHPQSVMLVTAPGQQTK